MLESDLGVRLAGWTDPLFVSAFIVETTQCFPLLISEEAQHNAWNKGKEDDYRTQVDVEPGFPQIDYNNDSLQAEFYLP